MERLGGPLRDELTRLGPMASIGDLARMWPEAVGEHIARNAWPARVNRDGTLVVYARDSIWAFELGHREAEIRERLGSLARSGIKFVPGPIPEVAPEPDARPTPPPSMPSRESVAEAERLAAGIDDAELRERVVKAVSASLEARRSGRAVW